MHILRLAIALNVANVRIKTLIIQLAAHLLHAIVTALSAIVGYDSAHGAIQRVRIHPNVLFNIFVSNLSYKYYSQTIRIQRAHFSCGMVDYAYKSFDGEQDR